MRRNWASRDTLSQTEGSSPKVAEPEEAEEGGITSAARRALKAWSNPAFRAGASERACKVAATRRRRISSVACNNEPPHSDIACPSSLINGRPSRFPLSESLATLVGFHIRALRERIRHGGAVDKNGCHFQVSVGKRHSWKTSDKA